MNKLRIDCNVRDFGWEKFAQEAVSRRPPISLYMMVAGSRMHTYAAKMCDLSSFKEHFLSPRAKP
jgi:hypothetical protein